MGIKTLLHEFRMSDVEDVEIYVAEPIYQWQQTDAGRWCTEHAQNLHWLTGLDHVSFGYRISIVGELEEQDRTFFELKYRGKTNQ